MRKRNTARLGANQVMALRYLESGEKTVIEMMQLLGMSQRDKAFTTLSSLRDRGLARIVGWIPTKGRAASVWGIGNGNDADAYTKKTKAENFASYKKKVISRAGLYVWKEFQKAQKNKNVSVLVIDGVKVYERGKGLLV